VHLKSYVAMPHISCIKFIHHSNIFPAKLLYSALRRSLSRPLLASENRNATATPEVHCPAWSSWRYAAAAAAVDERSTKMKLSVTKNPPRRQQSTQQHLRGEGGNEKRIVGCLSVHLSLISPYKRLFKSSMVYLTRGGPDKTTHCLVSTRRTTVDKSNELRSTSL